MKFEIYNVVKFLTDSRAPDSFHPEFHLNPLLRKLKLKIISNNDRIQRSILKDTVSQLYVVFEDGIPFLQDNLLPMSASLRRN